MTDVVPARAPARVPFADDLGRHGDLVALVADDQIISYCDLAERVAAVADRLGGGRRLVQVTLANHLDSVITYLAALQAGHVVLVSDDDPRRAADLAATYQPDVIAAQRGGRWDIEARCEGTTHTLHPELALLMSTSGSTGSAKVVRLSADNLRANAAAIADYLDLNERDRGVTSLPLHYCYGLSVLNSHLSAGAGLVLSDRSVVDRRFWEAVARHSVTGIAGVPHSFELLERLPDSTTDLPTLRYLTQAGGRMDPARVRRFAELGQRQGWEFYVMYGQTEATARMAYLPPSLAAEHPSSIGVPIPGGSFEIAPVEDLDLADGTGELVYRGANVMLGYAGSPADLAEGPGVDELRTGDLARRTSEGLYEIVGRHSRFVKLFGLRIDLDEVERQLARHGIEAICAGDDHGVAVATETEHDALRAARLLPEHLDVPSSAVAVRDLTILPRLGNGKPDHRSVLEEVRGTSEPDAAIPDVASAADLFAAVLQRPVNPDDTFVGLGGDSLSYVEVSLRLEELLGHLPPDWHTTPVRDLRPVPHPERRRLVHRIETGVVLRAVSIAAVVATHAGLFRWQGGAHVLLAVAGANFARFQLRSGHMLRSVLRVAVPSLAWLALLVIVSDAYDVTNVLLVNSHVGEAAWNPRWRYWFIEALVQILAVGAIAFAVPAVRRLERAQPFLLPLAVLAAGLVMRFDLVAGGEATRRDARPHTVLWLFALGWAIERAHSWPRRALLAATVLATVPGFFGQPSREAVVVIGLLLLLLVPTIPVVRPLNRLVGLVAAASLYIYLVHWQVYPPLLEHGVPSGVAFAVALAAGVAAWALAAEAGKIEGALIRRSR